MIGPEVMAGWIEDLGQIGRLPPDDSGQDRGLWRRPYTDEDERALAWVRERAEAAGLRVRRDAAGNLIARLDGSDPAATVVATGSHLDTVRSGGKYDGALGVLAGLAALADLAERRGRPQRPLELLVFEGEEGNRFPGFIGSYAMIEGRTAADFDGLVDADGVTASAALRAVGLDPARLPEACRSDLGAFVELHIEQGAVLERTATERGIREADGGMVGIVTAIVGARQLRLTFTGAPGHAGTTPMAGRRAPTMAVTIPTMPPSASRIPRSVAVRSRTAPCSMCSSMKAPRSRRRASGSRAGSSPTARSAALAVTPSASTSPSKSAAVRPSIIA